MTQAPEKYSNYNIFYENPHKRTAVKVYQRLPSVLLPQHLRVLDNLPHGGTVLDYGCGAGELLYKIRLYRPDLTLHGCDVFDFLGDERKRFIKFSLVESNKLPFGASGFDLVVSQQVLEHMHEPLELFGNAFRMLKPGGRLVCETPSPRSMWMPSLPWLLAIGHDREKVTMSFYDDPTHIRPYSRQSLIRLANMSGLRVDSVYKTRNALYLAALPLHLKAALKRQIAPLIYWFSEVYGGSNGIIAIKPE